MIPQVFSGSSKRFICHFKRLGVPTDPSTVTLEIRRPDGTVTTYSYVNGTVIKEATGIYYRDVTLDSEGVWQGRMLGTGTCQATDITKVEVRSDAFT